MGRRIEPDIIDADAPRAPIRPDQGYRVGARISAGDGGRTKLAGGIAAGIVVAGLVFASIAPLLPDIPDLPVAPAPSRSVATALPDLAIVHPPGPTRLVPVSAGGLRWLDPASVTMSSDAYTAPRGSIFVDTLGRALCICLDIPWSDDLLTVRVTLRRYSAEGQEVQRVELYELQTFRSRERRVLGDPIQVDAAISPDGGSVWISHTVRLEDRWEIGIDRVNLVSMAVDASRTLDPIAMPASEAVGAVTSAAGWVTDFRSAARTVLRVSPNGLRLAVVESVFSNPNDRAGLSGFQVQRLVLDADLAPTSIEVAVPAHDAFGESCDIDRSAWASTKHFVTICSVPKGLGVQPVVRVENASDITRDLDVGPPVGTDDFEWLLDAQEGVLFRWSTLAHVFTRLDVHTRTMTTLALEPQEVGTGDIGIWPAPVERATPWAPLTPPDIFLKPARIVGSENGTLIFALGYRSVADQIRDDRVASTGIWVFDAERAELVARWAPTALYDQIGYGPGFETLITVAQAGADGDGGPANWRSSLRFHDARNGDVVELIGNIQEASGFVPSLIAPNAPGGIAGF
jgi:hypothetical protein